MMNQVDLIKKIGHILTELQDQHQYVAGNPQQLNGLELELFLSNANFLTDHIQILMKTVSQHEVKEIEGPGLSTVENEPATFEFVLHEESSAPKFDFEEKKVEEIFNRPLSIEEQQIVARKKQEHVSSSPVATSSQEENGPEPFLVIPSHQEVKIEDTHSIIDTRIIEDAQIVPTPITPAPAIPEVEKPFVITAKPTEQPVTEKSNKQTLNEMLGGSLSANLKSEEPKSEISDLRQAISLNDKLLYVKDLFHGYNLAYSEVIELLNKMPDYGSAESFLQKNYAMQNNWSAKPETVERFYELLKRRFPVK